MRVTVVAAFLWSLGVGAVLVALPLMAANGSGAGWRLGLGFGGYFLAKACVGPAAGVLAERLGPRRVLLWASMAAAAPALAGALAGNVFLPVLQVAMGVAGGILRPVCLAVVGANASASGRSFAALAGVFQAALLCSQLAGAVLFSLGSIRTVFWAASVCLGAAWLMLALFFPAGTVCQRAPRHCVRKRGAFGPQLAALLAAVFGRTAGAGIFMAFLPVLVVKSSQLGNLSAGLCLALPGVALLAALPLASRLPPGADKRLPTLAGMGLCALCLWGLAEAHTAAALVLFCLGLGLGSAVSMPASMSLAAGLGRRQGVVMGVVHSAASMGLVAGPVLGGMPVFWDGQDWGVRGAFRMAAFLGLLCLLPLAADVLRWRKGPQVQRHVKGPALANT